jgi:hypothetical protein
VNTFPITNDVGTPQTVTQEIVASERGSACFVSQWLSFSTQSDKFTTEGCLRRTLHDKVKTGGAGMLEMFRQAARAEIEAIKDLGVTP